MKKLKLKNKIKYKIMFTILLFIVAFSVFYLLKTVFIIITDDRVNMFVASSTYSVALYDENLDQVKDIPRGLEVKIDEEEKIGEEEVHYQVIIEKETYYINEDNLVKKEKDLVKEKYVYVLIPTVSYEEINDLYIKDVLKKGDQLEVSGWSELNEDGSVNIYEIKENGYVNNKYVVLNEEESLKHYKPEEIYSIHEVKTNRFGGGSPADLDYYPVEKPEFENNIMPDPVYAWFLNNSRGILANVDEYIDAAKNTKINTFIVDIKDNKSSGYESEVMKKISPTNYEQANNTIEEYQTAIKKLKDAGFYVVGRITVFKDEYFISDHPEYAVLDTRDNKPYEHQNTYWPSPFQRDVWEFNVALAIESVETMGFNEIQFDYVRFPDLTYTPEKNGWMDFRNDYDESKAQAVQRFTMYAVDQLHKYNTYVSVDVFGESANGYVTAYGQYWPGISNVVDVISGMPYPDHFNKYAYGFDEPVWTIPYELLKTWGSYVMARQGEIDTPAKLRTWIQTYDVPDYKHPGGLSYTDYYVEEQIKGLFEAGLNNGYMTWEASSNLSRYIRQSDAYNKEYK